ncbi:hypothetical protein Pcinc_041764 [Petrolisthes cinctipes]|uniref:Uncharacterized protein n=1 Tax=Petrolisthes cinctipes TaxID=88211 RepID=A0AAE1BLE0_PETCI|nr:hypothetical protein Pcinc_041764 [Petrolisthes cinctipes]
MSLLTEFCGCSSSLDEGGDFDGGGSKRWGTEVWKRRTVVGGGNGGGRRERGWEAGTGLLGGRGERRETGVQGGGVEGVHETRRGNEDQSATPRSY